MLAMIYENYERELKINYLSCINIKVQALWGRKAKQC